MPLSTSFWAELKERRVVRVALVYLAVGWALIEGSDTLQDVLDLPEYMPRLVFALVVLGFPAAVFLAWAYKLTPEGVKRDPGLSENAEAPAAAASVAEPTDTRKSIAVLPLVNLSGDPENEYFSDGLTDELISVFARNPEIRIASRSSCFAWKGKETDVRQVAEKLGVNHVVEGSVRKAGNRVRISAQLVDAASDSNMWTETYDRELDDIFAIQSDIAEKIALALRVSLSAKDLEAATTDNARAYDYYLRGRHFLQLHDPHRAVVELTRAVELDPAFVRAWVERAQCHGYLAIYHKGGDEEVRAAIAAGDKALALAPDRGDVHAARGVAMLAAKETAAATREFERAIELNPKSFVALYNYARACVHEGELEKASDLFIRAAEADSSNFEAIFINVGLLRSLGKKELMMQQVREGLARIERHLQAYPNHHRAYYLGGMGWWLTGEKDKARRWAERAYEIDPEGPTTLYNLACLYAQMNDPDKAMDMLESLRPDGQSSRSWTENDPDLAPLKGHPRFQSYLETLSP